MTLSGITTALITPFFNGNFDKDSFLKLLNIQIKEGVKNFVLASTTGEGPTVEDKELAEICSAFHSVKSNLKFLLFAGSYSTKTSIESVKKVENLGASALLVVTPYYNRPPQKGLLLHFEKIAKATRLPIILYNVPSRTACSLTAESIGALSEIDNIIGIKEASGDMAFLKKIKQKVQKDFLLLSGDDPSCVEFFQEGGQGAISAGANVLAKELIQVFSSAPEKQWELFAPLKPFFLELFKESNPIGPKQILHSAGVIQSNELRLPLAFCHNPALEPSFKKLNKSFSE